MATKKGIIFDYGGTLDTNARHWSEVIWEGYRHFHVDIAKDLYRKAYVHGERSLAKFPLIAADHNFLDLLRIKLNVQTSFLVDAGFWPAMDGRESQRLEISDAIARYCYDSALRVISVSRPVVEALSQQYPLVLVSNFYGNIQTILRDFRFSCFQQVVESAVVGIRKPDPRIFQLGVDALGCMPQEVVVVGDSLLKDIEPAHTLGCATVWLKGQGWGEERGDASVADAVITDIRQLPQAIRSL